MKLIVAIIQPNRLEAVKAELHKAEVFRLTVIDVQGYGQQGGKHEIFRGQPFDVDLRRKAMILIGVNEDFVEPTIKALTAAAKTSPGGAIGDGKIFVLDLEKCFRIRTGEEGSAAI
jgi:nitrogen regulatory protein P-II 1